MIDIDSIELEKGCPATCVVILEEDKNQLENSFCISASMDRKEMYHALEENVASKDDVSYLVISNIDDTNEEVQDTFYHLVKDRQIDGLYIPEDTTIVLTIREKEGVKKISDDLYHFCVKAYE